MSYVLLKCVKEGSRLRVKMMSSAPFIKGINCQFPRNIRQEGLYYVLKSEDISLKTNFYSAMGKNIIIHQTFNIEEIKNYINDLDNTDNKIKPRVIFGDDEEPECIVCLTENKTIVFSPCGHYCCCSDCSKQCKKCPLCRGNILSMLNRSEITAD